MNEFKAPALLEVQELFQPVVVENSPDTPWQFSVITL